MHIHSIPVTEVHFSSSSRMCYSYSFLLVLLVFFIYSFPPISYYSFISSWFFLLMHYILLNFDVRTTLTLVQCRTSTPLNLSPSLELAIPSCCMSSPRLYCNTMTTAHTVKDSHTMQHNLLFFIKPLILIARLFHFIAIQSTSFFPMFV